MALWYGSQLLITGEAGSTGDVFVAFFAVFISSFSLGGMFEPLSAIVTAKAIAAVIYDVIERESQIDPLKSGGKSADNIKGAIEFTDVKFSYPTRPNTTVLDGTRDTRAVLLTERRPL